MGMCQDSQADPEGADEVRHPGRQVLEIAERQADALWVNLLAYALQNLHSACNRMSMPQQGSCSRHCQDEPMEMSCPPCNVGLRYTCKSALTGTGCTPALHTLDNDSPCIICFICSPV